MNDSLVVLGNGLTIDGGGMWTVLTIYADCIFASINITNGFSTGSGGGVVTSLLPADSCRFLDCHFVNNITNNRGGGIEHIGGNLVLERCLFQDNSSTGLFGGGGISVGGNTESTLISDCEFRGNTGAPADAIRINNSSVSFHGAIEMGPYQFIQLIHFSSVEFEDAEISFGGLLEVVK